MTALVVQQVNQLATTLGLPESEELVGVLKATAFRVKDGPAVTDAQMSALLIVAQQYRLNPWTKEIYAFPDKGGIVPVVGVDGWARIINEHPAFDGMEFTEGDVDPKTQMPSWIECVIYRKDRAHPIKVREYMSECRKSTGPWQSHPRRMLRHKAMMQAARIAFGFTGITDQDEAERILDIDGEGNVVGQANQQQQEKNSFMPNKKTETTTAAQRQADDQRTVDVEVKEVKEEKKTAPAQATTTTQQAQPTQQAQQGDDGKPKLTEGMLTTIRNKMEKSGKTDQHFVDEYAMKLEDAPRSMVNSILKWASLAA
jgi:phage recombination protein Bet